ncbi:MAG: DUF4838 domain-containing protein [Victivallales bacterium]|nr:DUF4838 domain-containing protein [Victivallales bacterium]
MKRLLLIVACCSCVLFAQGYKIEGPANPKPYERTAMEELKEYLGKRIEGKLTIGGVSNVTFVVGDSELAKANGLLSTELPEEKWVIKSFGDKVLINGGGTRGALYATYHFLEDLCDIHWWSDIEEYVPKASSLTLPKLDKSGKPVFIYRDIYRTNRQANSPRTAIRNRLNRNGDQGIPASLGGSFNYGPPYHCHTFSKYVPTEEYMESHPEYFSLVNGKRVGGFYQGHLCLSNPELKPLMLKKLLKYIEDGEAQAKKDGVPAPRLYDISMNDNKKFCTCDNCMENVKKYGRSGEYIRFLNYFAEEVAKVHPEILLTTLAYFDTEEPPKGGVRAAKNLAVKLCDTSTSQAISIFTERNKGFREKIEAWKLAADNLFIWDYSIIYGKNITGLPFPSEMYYGEQCKFYHENNVTGIFWEHEHPSKGDLYELKYFLECKMMEDPYQDADALIQLFMDRYYGPASKYALQYRRRIYEEAKAKNANVPWFPGIAHFSYISNDLCVECEAILDKAEAAVKGDAQLFRRVRRLRSGLDRLICMRDNGIIRHGKAFEGKDYKKLDSTAAVRRLAESYVDWFTQYKEEPKLVEDAKEFVKKYTWDKGNVIPPEQFKDRSYFEYSAFDFTPQGENMTLVEDPDSAVGRALMTQTDVKGDRRSGNYRLPFQFGYHDRGNSKTLLSNKLDKLPEKRGYNWYKVGTTTIPQDGYIYVTGAWTTQIFTSLDELIGKKAEIWISVKHEGPMYYSEQKAPSRVFVDRAILLID